MATIALFFTTLVATLVSSQTGIDYWGLFGKLFFHYSTFHIGVLSNPYGGLYGGLCLTVACCVRWTFSWLRMFWHHTRRRKFRFQFNFLYLKYLFITFQGPILASVSQQTWDGIGVMWILAVSARTNISQADQLKLSNSTSHMKLASEEGWLNPQQSWSIPFLTLVRLLLEILER